MSPGEFFRDFLAAWFAALLGVVAYQMLIRRISIAGLLTAQVEMFSPARLQLLLVTISGLAGYAAKALATHRLSPIPDSLVMVFAASHTIYLGAKFQWVQSSTSGK